MKIKVMDVINTVENCLPPRISRKLNTLHDRQWSATITELQEQRSIIKNELDSIDFAIKFLRCLKE